VGEKKGEKSRKGGRRGLRQNDNVENCGSRTLMFKDVSPPPAGRGPIEEILQELLLTITGPSGRAKGNYTKNHARELLERGNHRSNVYARSGNIKANQATNRRTGKGVLSARTERSRIGN